MARSFLCLGECMVELAETGGGTYRRGFAGDTFNAAWYARRALGPDWRVEYGSCIGTDAVSREMAAFMAAEGIGTETLREVPGRSVGLYMISLTDGERSFSYWRDRSAARTLGDDAAWLHRIARAADHVHLSGITAAILPPEGRAHLRDALAAARAGGTTVSFDTNLRPALWEDEETMRRDLMRMAELADIVFPSFDEEADTFADATPSDTAARYRSAGAAMVVVKNGAGPILISTRDGGESEIAVASVDRIVDTTAAGDSFAGTFLAAHLEGRPPAEAARAAADIAARVIQTHGALMR